MKNQTKVNWILEKDVFQENLDAIKTALNETETPFKLVEYVPFEGLNWKQVGYQHDDCVITYGSLNLAKHLDKHAPWTPTVFCNLPLFECTYYYTKLGEFLLNTPYIMLPFGELLRQKDFLMDTLGNNNCLFVRPSTGFKSFTGMVAKGEQWAKDVDYMEFYGIDPEKVVVVAEPRNIHREWRLIVLNQKVVTASLYKEDGEVKHELDCPDNVKIYAEKVAAVWQPECIFALDVCELSDGELKLIEINSASCSGLYACDKLAFVKAMNEAAIQEYNEYTE